MSDVPNEVVAAVHAAYGKARFEQSPELGQLFEAHSQCEFPPIVKDRTAKIPTKTGGEYVYKYADLATLKEATQPELRKHKLTVIQQVGANDKAIILRTMLGHASGQWVAATMEMPTAGIKAQDIGGAITYARRYARAAILDVASEDDDGSTATHGENKAEPGGPIRQPPLKAPAQSPNPSGEYRTGVTVPPKWKNAGKDLAELTPKELSDMADYLTKNVADPTKAKWQALNQKLLDAVSGEGMRREQK